MPVTDEELKNMSLNALAERVPAVKQLLVEYGQASDAIKERDELKVQVNGFVEEKKQREEAEKNRLLDDLVAVTGQNRADYKDTPLATVRLVHNAAVRGVEAGIKATQNTVQQGATATPVLTQPDPSSSAPPSHGGETEETGMEDEEKKRKAASEAEATSNPDFRGNRSARNLLAGRIARPRVNRVEAPTTNAYTAIHEHNRAKLDKERDA